MINVVNNNHIALNLMSYSVAPVFMGVGRSIAACLVCLIFCTLPLTVSVFAHHIDEENYNLFIFQEDGSIFSENISLNGTTTLPPSEATWELWNVGDGNSNWNMEASGSHFSSVVPVSDNLWNWTLEINVTEIECTCLLTISVPNGLDPMTKSIIVYLGEIGHRPMILDIEYTTTIVVEEPVTIEIDYVVPGINNAGVTVFATVCEAPHTVCLEEPSPITLNQTDHNGTVIITLNNIELNLADGIYQFEYFVKDALLLNSNSETIAIVIDTQEPIVSINGPENAIESQTIYISATVDDGYSGSSENLVWTIYSPDGKVRSPTTEERQDDYSLNIIPLISGDWTIELLVRDVGGHFVNTYHSFSIANNDPQAYLTLDGFEVANGSSITPANANDWILDCSGSTDTIDDMETLQYVWYVEGKARVSGKENFTQDDFVIIGQQQMMLVVTDDDGVESTINFTLFVEEQPITSNDSSILLGIFVLAIIVSGIFAVQKFSKKSKDSKKSKNIPKWGEHKKTDDSQDEELVITNNEDSIWNDKSFDGKS